ncbi:hypothetical protein S245_055610, partial [Arachis hypogaea]
RLSTANGDRFQIKYKLSEAVIKNGLLRIKTPFLLVQDLINQNSFPVDDVIRRYHYLHRRNPNNLLICFNPHTHTRIVKQLKLSVKELPCIYLPIPQAFKIVETDASDL